MNPRPEALHPNLYMLILPIKFSESGLPASRRRWLQSLKISPEEQGKNLQAILLSDASSEPQENTEKRAALIKQQVPIQRWLLCLFPVVFRGNRTTACSLGLATPVEACRPLFTYYIIKINLRQDG